jgi:alpha-galactosidase
MEYVVALDPPVIRLVDGRDIIGFSLVNHDHMRVVSDGWEGERLVARAKTNSGELVELVTLLQSQAGHPGIVRIQQSVRNLGGAALHIRAITTPRVVVRPRVAIPDSSTPWWSFQGGSYSERPDWIFPLRNGYRRENFQGMNAPDYGGGMPIVDCWSRNGGIALASLATLPEQIALPVRVLPDDAVAVDLADSTGCALKPGEQTATIPAALIVHDGDFFNALRKYGLLMQDLGVKPLTFPAAAYEPEWCAWGYERDFQPAQVLQTLSKARALGLSWATLDDGWQNADGDWGLVASKFPRGDADMKALVDSIHAHGLKARLWWVPLEAHDSVYSARHYPGRMNEFGMKFSSAIAESHPDWFQLNADGSRTQVSWWNSYTLCPALPEVREHYKRLVRTMIEVWGFDGFKIDGQNMNAVPPCYNPAHNHASPLDAPRAVPAFFRGITSTALAVNPGFVLYVCACGTNFSLYNLPFVNQPVAADPKNGWQVRHRAKTYKALLGGTVPFNGDHVELTNRTWDESVGRSVVHAREDFASTVGVGGVIATKFTLPGIPQPDSSLALTPEKERYWRLWLDVYNRERLSQGEYINLYDIAFDVPETHVVRKGDTLYYAFYADSGFHGSVSLRGLGKGMYTVMDYVRGETLGRVSASQPLLKLDVPPYLLLKAIPVDERKAIK